MKKRLIALLLAVVLVAALLPAAYAAEASFPFTDVPSGSWSRAGVAYAWENGLMQSAKNPKKQAPLKSQKIWQQNNQKQR